MSTPRFLSVCAVAILLAAEVPASASSFFRHVTFHGSTSYQDGFGDCVTRNHFAIALPNTAANSLITNLNISGNVNIGVKGSVTAIDGDFASVGGDYCTFVDNGFDFQEAGGVRLLRSFESGQGNTIAFSFADMYFINSQFADYAGGGPRFVNFDFAFEGLDTQGLFTGSGTIDFTINADVTANIVAAPEPANMFPLSASATVALIFGRRRRQYLN